MSRPLAILALAAALLPSGAARGGAGPAPAQRLVAPSSRPPLEEEPEAKLFLAWLDGLRAGRARLAEEPASESRARIADFARWGERDLERRRIAARALLDLYALCLAADAALESAAPPPRGSFPPLAPPPPAAELLLGAAVLDALRPFVREDGGLVAAEILPLRSQALERRVAAAFALARLRPPGAALALAASFSAAEPELQVAALPALVGWNEPRIHALFARSWEEPPKTRRTRVMALVEEHFRAVAQAGPAALGEALAARLAAQAARRLGGADWREASRALSIASALPDEAIVPSLIEALGLWGERHERGEQARRVQSELARELERRSGRSIGARVEGWRQWWRALREGRISSDPGERREARTVASFFGLRPSSDRIAFVVDRSGSMDAPFGPHTGTRERPGRTRFEEARGQLLAYLQASGPRTRFLVLLFEGRTEPWRSELTAADRPGLQALEAWLRSRRPGGGTSLQPALERVAASGKVVAGSLALEIDTIVVLCDGETAEGPGWARPFARRLFEEARVTIHCVQIGGAGDGTLERLAAESGGDFVRVDG